MADDDDDDDDEWHLRGTLDIDDNSGIRCGNVIKVCLFVCASVCGCIHIVARSNSCRRVVLRGCGKLRGATFSTSRHWIKTCMCVCVFMWSVDSEEDVGDIQTHTSRQLEQRTQTQVHSSPATSDI